MSINFTELKDTLLTRKSIRTYGNTYPTEEQTQQIREYIKILNEIEEPFNRKVKFCLQTEDFYGIRTFGFITGCKYWIYGVVPKNDPQSLKQFGYLFQLLILKCTQLNLATVWLGGSFTASSFTAMEYDHSKEFIPCVSPVGVDGKGMEMLGKVFGGRKRKNWETMFFNGKFDVPIVQGKQPEPFTEFMLECIRFAPSAVNAQPWRVVFDGKNVHVFGLNKMFKEIDLGITCANIHVMLKNSNFEPKMVELPENEIREKVNAPKDLFYMLSFISE